MPCTVKVNGPMLSVVHKGSTGMAPATIPDVCKTPSPGGPVPIPYPNFSMSSTLTKGTTTVKADGVMVAIKGSEFSLSNGDNPGVAGGVKSSTFMKESTWITASEDVKMDGKKACRFTDKKFNNHENCATLCGEVQGPVVVIDPRLVGRNQEDACREYEKTKVKDHEQARRESGMRDDDYNAMRKYSQDNPNLTTSFRATTPQSTPYIGHVQCKPMSVSAKTQKSGRDRGLTEPQPPNGEQFCGDYDMHDMIENGRTVTSPHRQRQIGGQINGRFLDGDDFPRVMHGPQSTLGNHIEAHPDYMKKYEQGKLDGNLQPGASKNDPVTVFDKGEVHQLRSPEDVLNMYKCKGAEPPPHWNLVNANTGEQMK